MHKTQTKVIIRDVMKGLELAPDHFVYYADVALDNLYNLRRNVLFNVIWNGDAIIAILIHCDSGVYCLQQRYFIDTCDEEACFVKCLRTFG